MVFKSLLARAAFVGALTAGLCTLANASPRRPGQAVSAPNLQKATAAFRAGSAAFARGEYDSAFVSFALAARLAPQIWEAHAALGAVLRELGRLVGAEKELEIALRLNANEPSALLNLAIVQAQLGNASGTNQAAEYAAAVKTLGRLRAINADPPGLDSASAAIPLASALVAVGQPAEAEKLLAQVQEANPPTAAVADALGAVIAGQGRYDEAAVMLRQALTLDPRYAAAYYHLGSIALERKELDEAVAELQKAHDLAPTFTVYTLQLARALLLNDAAQAAVLLLRDSLATVNESAQRVDLQYQLALALQSRGEIVEALRLFRQVLLTRPADANVLTNAGLAEVQQGDAPAGLALYRRALAIAETATLREDLGVAYLQQGNQTDALEQFRLGLKLEPDNAQLHYDLGLALKLKDDLAGAIPEFELAAKLDATLPDPPYTLGVIFMQQGRFQEAAANLVRVTELKPDNGDAWATLGSVYRQLDQPENAESALRRAIVLLPDQPSPHITLGALLAAQGKREEAATQRKLGADLTRVAVNRQKAQFLIDSGTLLMKRGKVAEALVQLQEAVATDPALPAGHLALADALEREGRKVEAAEERRKGRP